MRQLPDYLAEVRAMIRQLRRREAEIRILLIQTGGGDGERHDAAISTRVLLRAKDDE